MEYPVRFLVQTLTRVPCTDPECTREGCMRTDVRYATAAGEPVEELRAGDVYFTAPHEQPCYLWENCDGRHLICMVPGKVGGRDYLHPWNIDGRASNCTMTDERTHRCWVRHGDPATGVLHVDKNGHTCAAGAGSIQVEGFHGHLHNGRLFPC